MNLWATSFEFLGGSGGGGRKGRKILLLLSHGGITESSIQHPTLSPVAARIAQLSASSSADTTQLDADFEQSNNLFKLIYNNNRAEL